MFSTTNPTKTDSSHPSNTAQPQAQPATDQAAEEVKTTSGVKEMSYGKTAKPPAGEGFTGERKEGEKGRVVGLEDKEEGDRNERGEYESSRIVNA